jgi:methylamine dehydrogenase light chain
MQQSRIEERLENLAVSFAHETTRRHALAVLSRALLAALGVSVLEPVILDRRTEAGHLCGRWNYCGMYGRPCSCCGGSDTTCPSGLTKSTSFWHRCCSGWDVWYHDCCGSGSCPGSCDFHACGPSQPSWCGSTPGSPVCTLAIVAASCCNSPLC